MITFIKNLFRTKTSNSEQSSPVPEESLGIVEEPKKEPKVVLQKDFIIDADEEIILQANNYNDFFKDAVVPPKLGKLNDNNEWRVIDTTDNKIKIVEVCRVGGIPVITTKHIPPNARP